MRNSKAVASRGTRFLRSRTRKCRVCLKKRKEMVNIFDIDPEQGVSIADILSKSTGLEIYKGDSHPETVCTPCLQDAKTARSNQLIQQVRQQQDPAAMIGITEEESGIQVKIEDIEFVSEESAPQIEYFQIDEFLSDDVMHEATGEYISNEEPTKEYVHAQVTNEPIEDDLEKDVAESLDYEIEPSYLREQSEGTKDQNNLEKRRIFLTLNVEPNSFAFQCSSCQRLFPTKTQLKRHEYRHTKPTFKCSHCEMAFMYQSCLEQHIIKHTGERPFKCLQCQQDFKTQQQYTIHFKSHPKIPLFKCSLCLFVFKSLVELEEHNTTHKTFNCSIQTCQQVFHTKDALKKHFKLNHLKHGFICTYCEKSFKRHGSLVSHVDNKHCGPNISTAKDHKAKSNDLRYT